MSVAKGRRALQELFAALDADGNGVIDRDEFVGFSKFMIIGSLLLLPFLQILILLILTAF